MSTIFRKQGIRILSVLIAVLTLAAFTCGDVMALSVKTIPGYCLAKYKLKNFKTIKNPSWNFVKRAKYRKWYNGEYSTKRFYTSCKGTYANFQRWLRIDLDNPQSIAVTPDGSTMFIMTVHKGQKGKEYKRKGYIFKIDLKGMKADAYVQKRLKKNRAIYVDIGSVGAPYRAPGAPVYKWVKNGKSFYDIREQERDSDWKKVEELAEQIRLDIIEKYGEDENYDIDRYGYSAKDPTTGKWTYYEFETLAAEQVGYYSDDKIYNHDSSDTEWLTAHGFVGTEDPDGDPDYVYRNYVTRSPELVTGHGQTMAYNPVTNKLWFMPFMKQKKCRAVMVDPNTMTAEAMIDFKLKSSIQCPSTLTFDKYGNAFCYARTTKKKMNVPAHVAKIYKGKLSPDNVSFQLVMKGLRWTPGTTPQSIGYNPAQDRLYLLSDRSIVSLPAAKVRNAKNPSLKAGNLRATKWAFSREFEGLAYDNAGNGYFLVNKPDEVMLVNPGF